MNNFQRPVVRRFETWASAMAATVLSFGSVAPAIAQTVPEVVWLAGSGNDIEIISGEVQAIQGDRVRLRLPDGTVRLVGITMLDRERVLVNPGAMVTVALVDNSFFAQAVEPGQETLRVNSGQIYREVDPAVTVYDRDREVTVTRDGVTATMDSTAVQRQTVIEQRVVQEPVQTTTVIERRVVQPEPQPVQRTTTTTTTVRQGQSAQPVRGLW
ncbi:MAG: hypothetical protein MH825_04135 [Cyanobacteria bacterium]|nr:hypothetical protein [Cyanobacteriota bacterium]